MFRIGFAILNPSKRTTEQDEMSALTTLKQELESAPKSKAGFVNWARNQKLQKAAVAKMVKGGTDEAEAKRQAWNVGRHFDTSYCKFSDR